MDIWHGLSQLAFSLGPLLFLAAGFGYRLPDRKQLAKIAVTGVAGPLCGTCFVVGLIELATYGSGYRQPSLRANVAMALWGRAALSTLPPRMMLVSITMFGAVRFALRALRDTLWTPPIGRRISLCILGLLAAVIVWLAMPPIDYWLLDDFTRYLGLVPAVLTADYIMGARDTDRPRMVNWVGLGALAAGVAAAHAIQPRLYEPFSEVWWQPAALPSYAVAFLTCFLGRGLAKRLNRTVSSA